MNNGNGIATQAEVAAYLRIDPRTLRRWEGAGTGPPRIPGGRARYAWPAVRKWAASPAGKAHGAPARLSEPGSRVGP